MDFDFDCLGALLFGGFALGSREMRMAGEMRRMSSNEGIDEYAVVAERIAKTLRRKSVTTAAERYGVKKERRAWSADQSNIAA